MKQLKTADRHGFTGTGRTLTEAREDLDKQIAQALDGTYRPELVSFRGWAVLVWREPQAGWCRTIIARPDQGIRQNHSSSCGDGTKEETIVSAKRHLAQLAWTADDDDAPPSILDSDTPGQREFIDWVKFQRRAIRAKAAGLEGSDVWTYAAEDRVASTADVFIRVDHPALWAQLEAARA